MYQTYVTTSTGKGIHPTSNDTLSHEHARVNMHGWINDVLEKFILEIAGKGVLAEVREKCGFQTQKWELLQEYPDGATFALVFAVCELTGFEAPAAIEAFGGFFMKHFRSGGYASLLRCQGGTLRAWLSGVNDLHTHLKSVVNDKFMFPELWCTDDTSADAEDGSFVMHYMSPRGGGALSYLVVGIAKDAAQYYFGSEITLDLLESQGENDAEATTWRIKFIRGPDGKDEEYKAMGSQGPALRYPLKMRDVKATPEPGAEGAAAGGSAGELGGTMTCPFSGAKIKVPGAGSDASPGKDPIALEPHRKGLSRTSSETSINSFGTSDREAFGGTGGTLSTQELSELFPFFIKFNDEFVVTDCGKQIKKRSRGFIGSSLVKTMDIVHPALNHWKWTDLERCKMSTFELRPKGTKGQAAVLGLSGGLYIHRDQETDKRAGTLIVSPAVSSYEEMVRYGLSMDTDIPRHSAQRRLIMMNEHLKTESYQNLKAQQESASRERSLELKRLFVRYVSHEVRTPLSTVAVGLGLIQSQRDELMAHIADNREAVDIAEQIFDVSDESKEAVDIAVEILNTLLLYEKIEGGLLDLEQTRQPLLALVAKTAKQFSYQCRSSGVQLNLSYDPGAFAANEMSKPTVFVHVDKPKISQVIRKLLSNAFKFSPEGSTVNVKVSVISKGNAGGSFDQGAVSSTGSSLGGPRTYAHIDVKDEGAGITAENLRLLFASIIQFNSEELRNGGGSGIGLFVSKGIMDLHGGIIGATSAGVGKGTTFFIEIPITNSGSLPAHEGGSQGGTESFISMSFMSGMKSGGSGDQGSFECGLTTPSDTGRMQGLNTVASTPKFSAAGDKPASFHEVAEDGVTPVPKKVDMFLRVLLVDDSTLARKMIARYLKSVKICVEPAQAEDGAVAVDIITKSPGGEPFEVILMDFIMPNMDGPTATRIIRGMGFQGVIIGLTGQMQTEDKQCFLDAGADVVLPKPVDVKLLEHHFMQIIEHRMNPSPKGLVLK